MKEHRRLNSFDSVITPPPFFSQSLIHFSNVLHCYCWENEPGPVWWSAVRLCQCFESCLYIVLWCETLTAVACLRTCATPRTLCTTWTANGSADGRLRSSSHKETEKVRISIFQVKFIGLFRRIHRTHRTQTMCLQDCGAAQEQKTTRLQVLTGQTAPRATRKRGQDKHKNTKTGQDQHFCSLPLQY